MKTQYQTLAKEFQTFVKQIKQQLNDSRLAQVAQSTQDFQTSVDRVVTANPNSILIYPLVLVDKTASSELPKVAHPYYWSPFILIGNSL